MTQISSLEAQLQALSGKKNILLTGGGTCAIYTALKASNIPQGALVAVPNISCPDPVYALIWAGYKPYFIDVNPEDYNMNLKHFEQVVHEGRIKAVIAIHLFGNPGNIEKIKDICCENKIFLVEDCAQALGNKFAGKPLGSFGDVSIFSFGNGKVFEIGHGGSLHTNDKALYERASVIVSQLPQLHEQHHDALSGKHRKLYYRLFNAALKWPFVDIFNRLFLYLFKDYYLIQFCEKYRSRIIDALKGLSENRAARIALVNRYIKALKDKSGITLPSCYSEDNTLSRLTIQVMESELISDRIRQLEIPSNTMYPPLASRFKIFFSRQNLSVSMKLRGTLLNLWTNDVSEQQFERVIKILTEVKTVDE